MGISTISSTIWHLNQHNELSKITHTMLDITRNLIFLMHNSWCVLVWYEGEQPWNRLLGRWQYHWNWILQSLESMLKSLTNLKNHRSRQETLTNVFQVWGCCSYGTLLVGLMNRFGQDWLEWQMEWIFVSWHLRAWSTAPCICHLWAVMPPPGRLQNDNKEVEGDICRVRV